MLGVDAPIEETDVAIVGGGVGGIAAALWCMRLALRCVLLERGDILGGQLFHIHNPIPDYPGLSCEGKAFAARLTAQLEAAGIVPQLGTTAQDVSDEALSQGLLHTSRGTLQVKAIIAATGASRRRLDVPGATGLEDKGLYYSFSGHREAFHGRSVCVVGGGDGAFENALMLAACCPQVTILMRRPSPRARGDFVAAAEGHPRIEILRGVQVQRVVGEQHLAGVWVRHEGQERLLQASAMLVKIGLAPVSAWLGGCCALTPWGTVVVDANLQTSHPRVWAVGDLCTLQDPSISVSVGQACLAVRHIQRTLQNT